MGLFDDVKRPFLNLFQIILIFYIKGNTEVDLNNEFYEKTERFQTFFKNHELIVDKIEWIFFKIVILIAQGLEVRLT